MTSPTRAEYFDGWYADKALAQTVAEIMNRHMGLPPDALAGVVCADALPEITAGLALRAGDSLVDVACGRGHYGLVIAKETGASLTGVDFSEQALGEARAQAARMGVRDVGFRAGDLTASGLPDGCADAVLCTDSIQFAEPQSAGYAEIARILRPGGRAVLTCWEPTGIADDRLAKRIRAVNLRAGLLEAGFTDVDVRERPGWLAREYAMNAEAAALEAGEDPALRSFRDEGARSVAWVGDGLMRRVLAVAVRLPSAPARRFGYTSTEPRFWTSYERGMSTSATQGRSADQASAQSRVDRGGIGQALPVAALGKQALTCPDRGQKMAGRCSCGLRVMEQRFQAVMKFVSGAA